MIANNSSQFRKRVVTLQLSPLSHKFLFVLDNCRIVELIEGGAAKMSNKLLVGDHILKIAGKETKGLTMPQVRDLIVGPPGSVVTLCVNRKVDDHEQAFDIDLTREEIRTPRDNTPRNSAKSSTEALAGLTTSFSNFFN